MANIPANPDGKVATASLSIYMTDQIIPNCIAIFAGGDVSDKLIADTRSRFQDVAKLIAEILADFPDSL